MKIKENPIRDLGRIFIYLFFPWFVRLLPPGVDFSLYRLMGRLYCLVGKNKKKVVEENLSNVFPEQDEKFIKKAVVAYFENHFVDRMQLFTFGRLKSSNIRHYIRIENIAMLERSLAKGKGCILIHGHYGPAQLFIAAISLAGFPITQIGYVHKQGYSFIGEKLALPMRFLLESKIPGKIFYADRFIRPVFRCLKKNEIIANAGDGTGGGNMLGRHKIIPFMKRYRAFPTGSVKLAETTGADLLPLFMNIAKDKTYRIRFGEPLKLERGEKDIDSVLRQYAGMFESQVLQNPGMWHFWDEFPRSG